MFDLSTPHAVRKAVAGISMVLAPLLLLAGTIVSPALDSTASTQIANASAHPDRWLIAMFLFLCGWVFYVPALLGVMHMLRERGASYGHFGGAIALLGVLASIGYIAIGFVVWQMAVPAAAAPEMAALLDRVTSTAGTFIPFYLMGFGLTVGVLVLCAGLQRTRTAPLWMIAAMALGVIAFTIGMVLYSMPVLIAASALAFAGLGGLGRQVLLESLEAWEHTPEISGPIPAH